MTEKWNAFRDESKGGRDVMSFLPIVITTYSYENWGQRFTGILSG